MPLSLRVATNPTMLLCVALALLLAHGAPGQAQADPDETRSVLVRTSDLDLASTDGRRELDRRIRRAARFVCGSHGAREVWTSQCTRLAAENARRSARYAGTVAKVGDRTVPVAILPQEALDAPRELPKARSPLAPDRPLR